MRAFVNDVVDAANGVVARSQVDEIFRVAVNVPGAAAVDDELEPHALGAHVYARERCRLATKRDVEPALPGAVSPRATEKTAAEDG